MYVINQNVDTNPKHFLFLEWAIKKWQKIDKIVAT